jgi:hypothetical protein
LRARFSLIAVVFLSSSFAPLAAHAAAPKPEALVNQAVELRRNGDDEGALALLVQAYGLARAPRTAGQLGLCEQALGRWAEAETYLTEALKAQDDPWVKKNRRTIEDALAVVKSHIARIEIQGDPQAAEVWVNGTLVGKLPLGSPVRVAAGEVEVELRAPNFVSEKKTMRLEAGQYQRIILHASERPAAMPPPPPPPPAAASSETTNIVVNVPESHGGTATPPPTVTREPEAAASSGRLALKWVAWGLGAAALGVGVYGAEGNANGVSSFDAKCGIDPSTGKAISKTGPAGDAACATQKSDYESKARIGIGGFVAAGALAATGLILWLTEPQPRTRDAAALTCAPALGEGFAPTLGCAMRF